MDQSDRDVHPHQGQYIQLHHTQVSDPHTDVTLSGFQFHKLQSI